MQPKNRHLPCFALFSSPRFWPASCWPASSLLLSASPTQPSHLTAVVSVRMCTLVSTRFKTWHGDAPIMETSDAIIGNPESREGISEAPACRVCANSETILDAPLTERSQHTTQHREWYRNVLVCTWRLPWAEAALHLVPHSSFHGSAAN